MSFIKFVSEGHNCRYIYYVLLNKSTKSGHEQVHSVMHNVLLFIALGEIALGNTHRKRRVIDFSPLNSTGLGRYNFLADLSRACSCCMEQTHWCFVCKRLYTILYAMYVANTPALWIIYSDKKTGKTEDTRKTQNAYCDTEKWAQWKCTYCYAFFCRFCRINVPC